VASSNIASSLITFCGLKSLGWCIEQREGSAVLHLIFRHVRELVKRRLLASSCLSVRPYATTRLPLDGFSYNLMSVYFSPGYRERSRFTLKSEKDGGYFTRKVLDSYDNIPPNCSKKKYFRGICIKKYV
jgi:hypothetical protein